MINKYPKSIKLFRKWFENNQNVCQYDYELFSKEDDLESLETSICFDSKFFVNYVFFNRGSLIEFFDEHDIFIQSKKDIFTKGFYCDIGFNSTKVYLTRFESLTEAFEIAFNMLEEKL